MTPGSQPHPPVSPSDSGYGSTSTTPERPALAPPDDQPSHGSIPPLRGNGVRNSPEATDSDNTFGILAHPDISVPLEEPTTLALSGSASLSPIPKRSPPQKGFDDSRASAKVRATCLKVSPLWLPDRFVPVRGQSAVDIDKFRTSKPVAELTPAEKILRNGDATPDPFGSPRVGANAIPPGYLSSAPGPDNRIFDTDRITLNTIPRNSLRSRGSQISAGTVLTAGVISRSARTDNRRPRRSSRRDTGAWLFRSPFSSNARSAKSETDKHERRLAAALGLDLTQRVLPSNQATNARHRRNGEQARPVLTQDNTVWDGAQWVRQGPTSSKPSRVLETREVSPIPFRVLDAERMKNDYYASLISYSPNGNVLAVGLGNTVYGWSEETGMQRLNVGMNNGTLLTSIAFSSDEGGKAILAIGRSNNLLTLMSIYDCTDVADRDRVLPRFEFHQPTYCLSWKPTCTTRPSRNPCRSRPLPESTEELLVGDRAGQVWYYSVEWPERWEVLRDNWGGEMILLAVINVHKESICGLTWSRTGSQFATGGNDNLCFLFDSAKIGDRWARAVRDLARAGESSADSDSSTDGVYFPFAVPAAVELRQGDERHKWVHKAAVKAIAFCPWQDSLIATGGGFYDRRIHFHHTLSGTTLATIDVSAQVTSLVWSSTRREIAATLGFSRTAHPYRVAVFSWPACHLITAIPWAGDLRALHAIAYPLESSDTQRSEVDYRNRKAECIVVVSSKEDLRFYDLWPPTEKSVVCGVGMLGGSDILEHISGIDKDVGVIR